MKANEPPERVFVIRSKQLPWETEDYEKWAKTKHLERFIWEHEPSGRRFLRVIKWEEIKE